MSRRSYATLQPGSSLCSQHGSAHGVQRGTYALLLLMNQATSILVGRLGRIRFPAGSYVYVGSALGSGGLPARLARHLRQAKKRHWHIDHLLAVAQIVHVRFDASGARLECGWAQRLLQVPGAEVLMPGFGSSDCRCPTHLLYFGETTPPELAELGTPADDAALRCAR